MNIMIKYFEDALLIANYMNDFSKRFNTYAYKDCVDNEHEEVLFIANSLLDSDDYLSDLEQYLKSFIEDGNDTEVINEANNILNLVRNIEKVKD